uniref:Reverse transcriptase domain-containing protein n=1 Tax=Astyanax mexicanus TaxID=7994 RepID=A0A3B1K755_ASTMX
MSLSEAIKLVNTYSNLSEYSINWSKSYILPLRKEGWNVKNVKKQTLPIAKNIKYLGINISTNWSELFSLNFNPLLTSIQDSTQRWIKLPINLLGRIAAVKMFILPKVNYLFKMLPVVPTYKWFKEINSVINQFYWKNKPPRIKLSILQKDKKHGGLNAPNFLQYFLATQLQYVIHWLHPNSKKQWIDIEQSESGEINIQNLPFLSNSVRKYPLFKNPGIATTLTAWWRANKLINSDIIPCIFTPIWHNPDFLINNKTFIFPKWEKKGIRQLKDVFENNSLCSFADLCRKYALKQKYFLQYLQLKNVLSSRINIKQNSLTPPPLIQYVHSGEKKNFVIKTIQKYKHDE